MSITVQPAADRFVTAIDWLDSKHSFNFGGHYRSGDGGHGLLLVNNDDTVAPGSGFGTHAHRDMEIVTWVLSGRLQHQDSEGNIGVLYRGLAQRMSAGRGIRHSEMNASESEPVHFVQMWVLPDTAGVDPGYEQRDINEALAGGQLVPIASGKGHEGAVAIHQRDAVLWGARLPARATVQLPTDEHVHAFVALGDGALSNETALTTGDGVRISGPPSVGIHCRARRRRTAGVGHGLTTRPDPSLGRIPGAVVADLEAQLVVRRPLTAATSPPPGVAELGTGRRRTDAGACPKYRPAGTAPR